MLSHVSYRLKVFLKAIPKPWSFFRSELAPTPTWVEPSRDFQTRVPMAGGLRPPPTPYLLLRAPEAASAAARPLLPPPPPLQSWATSTSPRRTAVVTSSNSSGSDPRDMTGVGQVLSLQSSVGRDTSLVKQQSSGKRDVHKGANSPICNIVETSDVHGSEKMDLGSDPMEPNLGSDGIIDLAR